MPNELRGISVARLVSVSTGSGAGCWMRPDQVLVDGSHDPVAIASDTDTAYDKKEDHGDIYYPVRS
jgi:hypothetical protein